MPLPSTTSQKRATMFGVNVAPLAVRGTLGHMRWWICVMLLSSCARAPLKKVDQALRPAKEKPLISDDLDAQSLLAALSESIAYLETQGERVMRFGPQALTAREYASALKRAVSEGQGDPSRLLQHLQQNFALYEVYGDEDWGQALVTGYYEAEIEGRTQPKGQFTAPLFGLPKDYVEVDLKEFALEGRLRGRLVDGVGGVRKLVPLPARAEISGGQLNGSAPVLAYVDPVDAFWIQVQGSGVVRLENGRKLKLGYAGQNGHPYVSIGKFVFDQIPKEQMTLGKLEDHLRRLPPAEQSALLAQNPSYVFFKVRETEPVTASGANAVAGRTIAADSEWFPKGALALLEFTKPVRGVDGEVSWVPARRLVVDHDTGGAIRGPARVDLFFGRGDHAKHLAGLMRGRARWHYLVPKLN